MDMSWLKYKENNCIKCGVKYKYDSRQKKSKYCSSSCRSFSYYQRKVKGEQGIDYILCKICNMKFKEINQDHLNTHNISCNEYDEIYGFNKRTSDKTRENKNTLSSIMCEELSEKLSNSHKLENYINKYGQENGEIRYNKMILNKKYKNGINSYIDKYGNEDGLVIFKKVQNKKAITLENQINKHGKEEGEIRYNKWKLSHKYKNTLLIFREKYGKEEGLKKWLDKNNKISLSNSKIDKSQKKEFLNYIIEVNKYTRISISMNNLLDLDLRGKENGYDLDHLVSKIDGFRNKIPTYIIGHISNLKIVDSSYNRKKQHRSDIDFNIIIEEYEKDIIYKKLIEDINIHPTGY